MGTPVLCILDINIEELSTRVTAATAIMTARHRR